MQAALELIRQFEGFRETPYWDVNAFRTGYGSDTVTMPDGRVAPVKKGTRITREEAERDLVRRVQTEFMPRAAKAVGPAFDGLTDAQKAALVSITYNYGNLPAPVAQAVRTGDSGAVAAAIRALGAHNGGINDERRKREAAIYAGENGAPENRDRQDMPQPDPAIQRVANAYANGWMTPEDAALYENGMAEGFFPKMTLSMPVIRLDGGQNYRGQKG